MKAEKTTSFPTWKVWHDSGCKALVTQNCLQRFPWALPLAKCEQSVSIKKRRKETSQVNIEVTTLNVSINWLLTNSTVNRSIWAKDFPFIKAINSEATKGQQGQGCRFLPVNSSSPYHFVQVDFQPFSHFQMWKLLKHSVKENKQFLSVLIRR